MSKVITVDDFVRAATIVNGNVQMALTQAQERDSNQTNGMLGVRNAIEQRNYDGILSDYDRAFQTIMRALDLLTLMADIEATLPGSEALVKQASKQIVDAFAGFIEFDQAGREVLIDLVRMFSDDPIKRQQQITDVKYVLAAKKPIGDIIALLQVLRNNGVDNAVQLANMLKTANDAMAKSLTKPTAKSDARRGLSLFKWGRK